MIDQLIRGLDFNPQDPFDIKKDIFSKRLTKSSAGFHDKFVHDFYRHWILWTFDGEFDAATSYPIILSKIQNNQYGKYLADLSESDVGKLCGYFNKMIRDEVEHTTKFVEVIKSVYSESASAVVGDDVLSEKLVKCTENANSSDLIDFLCGFYNGECYVWVALYKFYKSTESTSKKNFLKTLLVEESQHNNNIYKFLKHIRQKNTISPECFVESMRKYRLCCLDFVKQQYSLSDTGTKKDKSIVQLVYDSEWHRDFNRLVIKKIYQVFGMLYPDITLEEFINMVNEHDEWLMAK
jgi:rubrerythrin